MTDLPESKGDKKMDWMYRDATQIVDREEYLLGRKVDSQLEASLLPPGKDQECLPPSIFTSGAVESQVDIARKLQEDPLYLIKKKEIESRQQLLKNPRKMKQLQEMIARQQAATEKLKRKQLKERKKKKLDALLVNKCKKIFGGDGTKKLVELGSDIETSSSSSSSSIGRSDDEDVPKKKKKKARKNLDRLLAIKYKKVIGNLNMKGLAEMDSNSESSSEDEENVKLKRKKERSLTHSSDESHKPDIKKKVKKGNERRRKCSSSESESKSGNKNKANKRECYSERKRESIEDDKRCRDYRSRKQSSSVSKSKQFGRSSSNEDNRFNKVNVKRNRGRSRSEERRYENYKRSNLNEKYGKISKSERESFSERSCDKKNFERGKRGEGDRIKLNHKNTKREQKSRQDGVRYNVKEEASSRSSSESASHSKNDRRHKNEKTEIKISIQRNSRKLEKDPSRYKRESSTSSSTGSSSEERGSQPKRQYGLVLPANYVPKKSCKEEIKSVQNKEEISKPYKKEDKRKLTDEEKDRKLKEMMDNAKWRDEQRDKNVKSFKEKEKAEKDDYVYNEDFMRKQMALAVSQGTVESRVKANINTIQRSSASMSEHFARRK